MKTLYVTDLDGTLLNRQDTINQSSLTMINELIQKGMLFTYATARSLVSASVVTKGLSASIPAVVYNGAFMMHPATGEILSSTVFLAEEIETIVAVLQNIQVSPLVYSFIDNVEKVSWVLGKENEGMERYLNLRTGDRRLRPLNNQEGLYAGNIFYVTCIGEKEELMPVYEFFSKDDRYRCTIQQELYRTEYWCEIMPKRATKAEAISQLKVKLGCDRIVSFGDAINDIPMFEISDECYAVANAVEELKAIATGVIESNEENGVANWLVEHVTV